MLSVQLSKRYSIFGLDFFQTRLSFDQNTLNLGPTSLLSNTEVRFPYELGWKTESKILDNSWVQEIDSLHASVSKTKQI